MEQPRELPLEILAELRTSVAHLATDVADMRQEFRTDVEDMRQEFRRNVADMRQEFRTDVANMGQEFRTDVADMRQEFRTDIRRLDQRVFQLMPAQFATLAAALGSLVAALLS